MATTVTTVFVLCCVYMVFGASVYQQAYIKKTRKRDIGNVLRAVSTDSTFETETIGRQLQKCGNPVFNRTIHEHNGIFLDTIADNIPFQEKMKKMYEYSLRKDKWELQKDTIVNESTCAISEIDTSESVIMFHVNIIMLYTRETDCIYKSVNAELREYRNEWNPSIGPFALLLNVILSQWTSLSVCTGTTYHGVSFNTKNYTVNTVFTWTGFTSSSENIRIGCKNAKTALFIINNSVVSDWGPRQIKNYSHYLDEDECLYPATAIFKVTHTENEPCGDWQNAIGIHISLQRGETQDNEINGAAIVGRSLGGVAYLALIAFVVVM